MIKKSQLILSLIVLAAFISFVGCGSETIANAESKKKEEALPVEVTHVTKGDISAYFTGTASLEAEEEAKVVAKTGGVIKSILVEEGDMVHSGQVLARLEDDKPALDLQEAQARLKQLENQFKRKKQLHHKKIVSTEIFEQIKSDYDMQKTKVAQAQLMKNYTAIRAPIGGIIAQRFIKKGNMLPQNEACFHIADFDPLLAILHVPERELSKLKKNQLSSLSVDAMPGKTFKGKILRISPVVDPQTGTFKVTVAVTDPGKHLKPGMFSRVRIVYDVHTDTMLLPKDAVLTEGNESIVFLVKDQKVARTVVEVGYVNGTHLEIKEGIKLGDQVVQNGLGALKDGSKVEVLNKNSEKGA